jgi:hypothetical protein
MEGIVKLVDEFPKHVSEEKERKKKRLFVMVFVLVPWWKHIFCTYAYPNTHAHTYNPI